MRLSPPPYTSSPRWSSFQHHTNLQTARLTEAEVPRISLDRALVAFTAGEAVFVDVRSADAYAASHVAGAVSIPLTNIEIGVSNLSLKKDQWIITYCT
jgi:hypothetical protein